MSSWSHIYEIVREVEDEASAAMVAQVGTREDGPALLVGVAKLARLKFQAEGAAYFVQAVVTEERQQVDSEPPFVVTGCVLADRLVTEHAVDLDLQLPLGVFAERGDLCRGFGLR
jgi:hypothetical protein